MHNSVDLSEAGEEWEWARSSAILKMTGFWALELRHISTVPHSDYLASPLGRMWEGWELVKWFRKRFIHWRDSFGAQPWNSGQFWDGWSLELFCDKLIGYFRLFNHFTNQKLYYLWRWRSTMVVEFCVLSSELPKKSENEENLMLQMENSTNISLYYCKPFKSPYARLYLTRIGMKA